VLFDIVAVEFSERFPIDAADFVPRRVLAVLFELNADALGAAQVHTRHQPFAAPAGAQREVRDSRQHFGIEVVLIVGRHWIRSHAADGRWSIEDCHSPSSMFYPRICTTGG